MRGEETQILGALHLEPTLASRPSSLLCLPGTHTKWVLLDEGTVQEFLTATTGELFALLVRSQRAGERLADASGILDRDE